MKLPMIRNLCLTIIPLLVGGRILAQNVVQMESPNFAPASVDVNEASNNQIIFSNLGPTAQDKFNSVDLPFPVAGKSAGGGVTEAADAIAFTPKVNAQAKVLLVALGYISGTKKANIGLYNDSLGTVGAPISGGQGSTTQMPDVGVCCQLAKITLPGSGITLSAGTQYWLVISPGDPTFSGGWQLSHSGAYAFLVPPSGWAYLPGQWPAAQIRGTRMSSPSGHQRAVESTASSQESSLSATNVAIFSNLGPTSTDLYIAGNGIYVAGKDALQSPEIWLALPFTAKTNSHAKTLAAAIGYQSGTMKVNLGLYSDDNGQIGTPLAGGQGSTTNIPPAGDCCGLTTVTLAGSGVALIAAKQYWLLASPDDVNAPTFQGIWQDSNLGIDAYTEPTNFIPWTSFTAGWLAAEIRGTNP